MESEQSEQIFNLSLVVFELWQLIVSIYLMHLNVISQIFKIREYTIKEKKIDFRNMQPTTFREKA